MLRRVRRAMLLSAGATLVVVIALMFLTAIDLAGSDGPATSRIAPLGVTIWEAKRTVAADASSVTLSPGIGVLLLLAGVPILAALLVLLRDRTALAANVR
jgi:hypothetical protein